MYSMITDVQRIVVIKDRSKEDISVMLTKCHPSDGRPSQSQQLTNQISRADSAQVLSDTAQTFTQQQLDVCYPYHSLCTLHFREIFDF